MISSSGPADTVPAVKIKYNDFVYFTLMHAIFTSPAEYNIK